VPYYSTYYRKLYGIDSPSGRPLFSRRITKTRVAKKQPKKIVVKKKQVKSKKKIVVKKPLRKAKTGLSRMRRSQLMLKPVDIYEKQMAQRIQRKSGMTYVQTMHLIRKARDYDIDVEHLIDWKLSKDKREVYEFATKQLEKLLEGHELYKEHRKWHDESYWEDVLHGRGGGKTMRELGYERMMFGF